jgi:hypothetical protein
MACCGNRGIEVGKVLPGGGKVVSVRFSLRAHARSAGLRFRDSRNASQDLVIEGFALAESPAESIPRFRDSRKKGGVMKGFLGSFLRRQENRVEPPSSAPVPPKVAGEPNDPSQIRSSRAAQGTELPPPEGGQRGIGRAEPSTAGKAGCTEDASGRLVWDAPHAAAVVAEVDRLIEKELARAELPTRRRGAWSSGTRVPSSAVCNRTAIRCCGSGQKQRSTCWHAGPHGIAAVPTDRLRASGQNCCLRA